MGAFEEEVAAIVRERFGSIAELARVTNLNEQTLHSLFNKGSFGKSRSQTVTPIAEALEVDPHWLMRGKLVDRSTRFKGFVEVPLFTSITAGQPASPDQTDERFPVHKELAERYPGAFLLRVSGESMNRILPAGCYALVEPCEAVGRQNMPYAVAVGSLDATVKRVRALGNGFALTPDSTDVTFHEVIYDYTKEDTEQVTVMGRVVSYYLPLNWSF